MGRTILCPHCKSTFDEDVLKKKNSEDTCPVCGESLLNEGSDFAAEPKETVKWYYYEDGTLTPTLYDDENPVHIFDAVDVKDAKRQLKEIMPNSPLFTYKNKFKINCPYCGCDQYTILNQGYSFLTGFWGSGSPKRVCNHCMREF